MQQKISEGGVRMFRKQERTLIVVCIVIAAIMLYAVIKSIARLTP